MWRQKSPVRTNISPAHDTPDAPAAPHAGPRDEPGADPTPSLAPGSAPGLAPGLVPGLALTLRQIPYRA